MEFHKMLALSTGHLTRETIALLEIQASGKPTPYFEMPVAYAKRDYGWFVHVADNTPDCPTDLEACLHLAKSQGCNWIMFDRDVETIEQLVVFPH